MRLHWDDLTAHERRGLVALFVRKVEVHPAAYRGAPTADRLVFVEE